MDSATVEQGSAEWHALRAGKVTASRMSDLMAKTKSGYGASRASYMAELIVERMTGQASAPTFTNAAMQWGTEKEPEARSAYEFQTGETVDTVGFVLHPTIAQAGASPDGLVGHAGLVEIKCPNTATHIETLLIGKIPDKYAKQMLWQMICTGREWCDFVSYDPRMPGAMQLFVQRLHIDAESAHEMETEVKAFLSELDAKVTSLRSKYEIQEAA